VSVASAAGPFQKKKYIGHTLRKERNPLKNKHWIGIGREPEGQEERRKPGKGPLWRKQENATKHGARLRRWRATES
jgi:hypothetical protein